MQTAFISHPDTLLHVMEHDHPESPARISAIKDRLFSAQILDFLQLHDAPQAQEEHLLRVHTPDYIQRIRGQVPTSGLHELDCDTAMGPMTLTAALHAAGAVVHGVDLVASGRALNAFCCVRPPGHHASRDHAAGFCIFNNVAVGVAHAMARHGIERVAIIDFDAHHGDGTEDIFRDNPRVMLCSTFQHPCYPYRGAETRTDRMINVPLAPGSNGTAFRTAVENEFAPALMRFQPEMIFVSAGFDAHRDDPMAELNLVRGDYIWITDFIKKIARRYARDRIVSVLEGGYDLIALADSVTAHVRTLADL
jgi:acetoin utilization deacetylase AcuC-like enzyme